jgi:cytoplasmic iron level regulating protein YaaA (DUF328/UPF0246 family)
MKILLAPSETKCLGGSGIFDPNELSFGTLRTARRQLIAQYEQIIQDGTPAQLSKMFGLKKESDIATHRHALVASPTMKAIERYTGVAFDHLDYGRLPRLAQEYIDNHVLLFSNLFGVLRADDHIPDYRLKQAETVGEVRVDRYYREILTELLDAYLRDEEILDLRAGYYDKFYTPGKPYMTLKFIKEGKVVSHWAKAYRGIVLRAIATKEIETLEAFLKLEIEGLELLEMTEAKSRMEVVYGIDTRKRA